MNTRTGFRWKCPCGQKVWQPIVRTSDADALADLLELVHEHRRDHEWEVTNLMALPRGYVPVWRRRSRWGRRNR